MTGVAAVGARWGLPRRIPLWALALFSAGFAAALSPNLVYLFGVHNDYEMLIFKSPGLLHHEAEHLFSIARPVAALFSNLTMLPVETFGDYRWTRLFSTLTVCFLGYQMASICVHRLRTSVLHGTIAALVTFLVPAYIYSVLNAPAWGTHLLPVLFAFIAYEVLSRTNIQALAFIGIAERRDLSGFWHQTLAYARLRPVWMACLVLQLAFYDFPPNALVLTVFPVIAVLLSRAPPAYRMLIAVRDLGFVAANIAIYVVSAKLLYLPIVRLLTIRNSDEWRASQLSKFDERIAGSYNYKFNTDIGEMLERLENLSRVAGDLWFLPQSRLHIAAAAVVAVGIVVATVRYLLMRGRAKTSFHLGLIAVAITIACFLLSSAAVLGAGGGFVSYRTIPVTTAIAAIALLAAVKIVAQLFGRTVGDIALLAVAAVAVAGNFELNYLTMRLARSETAYYQGIIQQTLDSGSNVLFIVDPRPFSLPEDNPVLADQHGRPIPPYELGCLSSVCLQNGAIVTILAEERGLPRSQIRVYPIRGADPVAGITCELLQAPTLTVPPGASEQAVSTIKFWRSLAPFTCIPFSLAWRDIDR